MRHPWKNIGLRDRQARFVLGTLLLGLTFFATTVSRWIVLAGLALAATAYFEFCPVWFGFRINTRVPRVKVDRKT